jgi:CHASE3 domain sensor protein/signal transduction histidine kinase
MVFRTERIAIGAFGIAASLFAAIGFASWRSFERSGGATEWVFHTHEVMLAIEGVTAGMRDGEIGQRGYLLTGKEEFLEPLLRAMPRIDGDLRELGRLTKDSPAQQQRLRTLAILVEHKRRFMDETIELQRRGEGGASAQLVATGRGKELMDEIRRLANDMMQEERALLAQRAEERRAARWRTTALLLFGNTLAFAGVAFAALVLVYDIARRRRRSDQASAQRMRDALEVRAAFEASRLPRVLESLPVATLFVDADGPRVTMSNKRARALLGEKIADASGEELARLGFVDADGTPLPFAALPFCRALVEGEEVNGVEVCLAAADGQVRRLRMYASPVRAGSGAIEGAVISLEDPNATEAAALEREASHQFGEMFTTLVGHDVRNPLTVLAAGTDALLRRRLPESEARIVERMRTSVTRASRMIDQMIDVVHARLGGGIPLKPSHADLGDIARQAVEWIEVQRPERDIAFVADGDLEGEWDPERLGHVVSELVDNAMHHSALSTPVRVVAKGENGRVLLDVVGGARVPDEARPFLFDPFRRVPGRVRLRSSGLGMGLYLSTQIAQAHGGTLRLVDDPPDDAAGGTRFRLELPRRSPP